MTELRIHSDISLKLGDREFEEIRKLIWQETGIYLGKQKKSLVISRLAKRLRTLGVKTFKGYLEVLKKDWQHEFSLFIDALTTNYSYFFRENRHLELLKTMVIPCFNSEKKLYCWSAGCATGEEPYSIAITIMEALGPELRKWDLKIYATDISSSALAIARRGIYKMEKVENASPHILKKYFLKGRGKWEGCVKVKDEVRKLVVFKKINLLDPKEITLRFHLIFCRNVLIYFNSETRRKVLENLKRRMKPGGFLFLGHSETLPIDEKGFSFIEPSAYRLQEQKDERWS